MKRLVVIAFVFSALIAPSPLLAAWIANGTNLTNVFGVQYSQVMIPDGAGGAIVAWSDGRGASFDIYAQRVNANGNALWTANGVALCTATDYQVFPVITSDGAGGAIVAWVDYRPGTGGVYVRRITAAGAVQWTADGVGLATHGLGVTELQIVSDGTGGAIVVWTDGRNYPNYDVYARRVNSAGVAQWAANGVAIGAAAGDQNNPDIVSDQAGGAIMAWTDYRVSPMNADIYAQRVNGAGTVQWAVNGAPVCTASSGQVLPRLVSDGSGGVVLGWYDQRSGSSDIYAQRLNGSGAPLWSIPDGTLICDAANEQYFPVITSDGAGGAILAWVDYRSGGFSSDVYAQRINATGGSLWASNGVLVCGAADDQFPYNIASDGSGGAVVTWDDRRFASTNSIDAYAQRLDAYGAPQWTWDGVGVSVGPGYQSNMRIAVDGTGAILFAWDDARGDENIYAQRVEATYGYWGHPEPTVTAVADIPHDQGGKVAINWTASSRDLPTPQTISFYSIWRAVSAIPMGSASIGLDDLRGLSPSFNQPVYLSTPGHYYEQVGTQAAHAWPGYSFSAETRADSVAGATGNEFFMVAAHDQYNDFIAFPSNEATGHSVDNLAPAAPLMLTAQRVGSNVNLKWNGVHVRDLKDYSVYRKTSSGVTPVPINFLASSEDTVAVDTGAPASALYYIVTAYDVHANQGPPSNEASVQATTGVGNTPPIATLTVLQNQPNPFGGTTDLRIGLPSNSDVSIEVFDVAGRRVRTQALAQQAAGWRTVPFDGRDQAGRPLASGVYFYRITASGKMVTNKMVIAR